MSILQYNLSYKLDKSKNNSSVSLISLVGKLYVSPLCNITYHLFLIFNFVLIMFDSLMIDRMGER